MGPHLDAAARAIGRERSDDLRDIRVTALAFKVAVLGPHPIAVAYAVDEDGVEQWLAVRGAADGVEAAYGEMLNDLLRRGLRVTRPMLVDADGYGGFARRLELAFGPVVHVGRRECRGGLAW